MRRNRDDRWGDGHPAGPGRAFAAYEGTSGNDTYYGTSAADTINGYAGNDTLSGGDGDDTIDGGDGDDVIDGGAGHNELRGGAGYNQFTSSGGVDTIYGTGSLDTWYGDYTYSVSNLVFTQRSGTLSNGTTLFGIDAFSLTTGYGNDRLRMAWQQRYSVDGGPGIDSALLNYNDYQSYGDYNNISGIIKVGGGVFNITMYTELTAEGYSTRNYVANVEDVNIIGSSYSDNFEIRETSSLKDYQYIRIDGRLGDDDSLKLDLAKESSRQIIVSDDGTITSDFGAFMNIERYAVVLGGGTNKVILGPGDDTITSAGTGDELRGGAGDDVISTSGAGGIVDGGIGADTWIVTLNGDSSFSFNQGNTSTFAGFEVRGIESFEIYYLEGPAASDFYLDGFGAPVSLTTYNGNDRIMVDLSGQTAGVTLIASAGQSLTLTALNITLTASASCDLDIVGANQDDVFMLTYGDGAGLQSLDGGDGVDSVNLNLSSYTADVRFAVTEAGEISSSLGDFANTERFNISLYQHNNVIALGAYDDVITVYDSAGNGSNTLAGGGGGDMITGGQKSDIVVGGDGSDTLLGKGGDDSIDGGAGNDLIDGGVGIDTAVYGEATASVRVAITFGQQNTGGAGIDLLNAIENLTGSDHNDVLTGDGGANRLAGAGGNDRLFGGAGADVLLGGTGIDRTNGGAGADSFTFTSLSDFGTKGRDRITDFSHADGDRIDVKAIDPNAAAGDQAFAFVGDRAFSHSGAAELRATAYNATVFLLQGDADGDGRADFAILVTADQPLTGADFVL